MNLVKAASFTGPATQSFEFTRPERRETAEPVSQPIEAMTSVDTAPAKDTPLAKEGHFLDQIAGLEKALREKEKDIETAKAAAFAEGKKAGEKAALSKSDQALEFLKGAITQGSKTLEAKLEAEVETGVDLARTILRQILGDANELPSQVTNTAARWKQELAAGTILRLRVAADDFTDQDALDALQETVGNVEIVPQLDLKPGACLFDLKLGALDASIDHQLAKAEELLEQSADPAEAG